MYNSDELKRLQNLSKQSGELLKVEMKKFDLVIDGLKSNVQPEEVGMIEKVQMLTTKAMNLAKAGKNEEANAVMEELKNLKK